MICTLKVVGIVVVMLLRVSGMVVVVTKMFTNRCFLLKCCIVAILIICTNICIKLTVEATTRCVVTQNNKLSEWCKTTQSSEKVNSLGAFVVQMWAWEGKTWCTQRYNVSALCLVGRLICGGGLLIVVNGLLSTNCSSFTIGVILCGVSSVVHMYTQNIFVITRLQY